MKTIKPYVDDFIRFAREHSRLTFFVTRIGCGIAGFRNEQRVYTVKRLTKKPLLCHLDRAKRVERSF